MDTPFARDSFIAKPSRPAEGVSARAGSSEMQFRYAARLLDTISDACVTLDRDWRILYVNHEAARINKKPAEDSVGRFYWEEWPASVATEFESQFRRAMIERVTVRFRERYHVPGVHDDWIDVWLDVTAYPAADEDGGGLHLVYRDVTERIQRERRQRFLAELAERTWLLTDPDAIIADVVVSVGKFLSLSRCTFADIDLDADTCTVHQDYCADDSVASIAGRSSWSAFGPSVLADLEAGRAVAVNDVRDDNLQVPPEYVAAYDAIGVRAHVTVPSVYSARLVSVISAQSVSPRQWRPEEIELLRTVLERTWLTVELARQQHALRQEVEQRREQGEYLRRLIESSPDCIKTLELDGTILSISESGLRLLEIEDAGAVCGKDWSTFFWEHEPTRHGFLSALEVARSGGTGRFQGFCPTTTGKPKWWDVVLAPIFGADGKPEKLLSSSRDITALHEVEERERFLADLTARMRALLDPETVLYETARAVGEYLGAHRCMYVEIDEAAATLSLYRDFIREDEGMVSMAGTHSLDPFGAVIIDSLRSGAVTQSNDIEQDPRLGPEQRAVFRVANIRSFLAVPLHKAGHWVAILSLHYARPRGWTEEEAELLNRVVERTWLAVENARLFRETQRRAEWEALLNQISTQVRAESEPDAILQAVVSALGQGLQADRCYFVRYNQTRDHGTIFPEWIREESGLQPIAGVTRRMSLYAVNRDAAFKAGQRQNVPDTMAFAPEAAAPLLALDVRALLRVPIEVGDQMTALGVAMAREPRHWAEDEVRLVENVAALIRSALESARLRQRERNIAEHLQQALLPPAPEDLPGMALASYYRPALDEAGVGGDFFDVFAVEKGCSALVVADLSGKGLAAAQQVATVRNMLRFAVYNTNSIAEAIDRLHRTLVENDLLSGFATLFVGLYGHAARIFTYVNCGQEPGLLWRATTGQVELLTPTGPVLGGFGSYRYEQATVTLAEGDVLTLFTDGLTEVGPSRKELLEVEGIIDIVARCCRDGTRPGDPHAVVEQIVAGVDEFARGGIRDDMALLVGILARDTASQ